MCVCVCVCGIKYAVPQHVINHISMINLQNYDERKPPILQFLIKIYCMCVICHKTTYLLEKCEFKHFTHKQ